MKHYHYHDRKKFEIFLLPHYTIFFFKLNKNGVVFCHGRIHQVWKFHAFFMKLIKMINVLSDVFIF